MHVYLEFEDVLVLGFLFAKQNLSFLLYTKMSIPLSVGP